MSKNKTQHTKCSDSTDCKIEAKVCNYLGDWGANGDQMIMVREVNP